MIAAFLPMRCLADAQEAASPAHPEIEATLVYNFLKYTSWPESDQRKDNLKICILGNDAADKYIYPMQNRTAQRAAISVAQIDAVADAGVCDLLLIHRDQVKMLPELLRFLKGKPILTVSDVEGFAEVGGMIEMIMGKDGRMHLYISRDALADAKLSVRPRLINLSELGRTQ